LAKKCVENRAWTFIFGFILLFIWLVVAIIGIILTAISFNGPDVIQAFCDGQIQNDQLKFLSNQIKSADVDLNSYINSYMCSYHCPCPLTASTTWNTVSEVDWNSVGRTKVVGNNETDSAGRNRLFFVNPSAANFTTVYNNF